ncbi:MAG: DUF1365 domain-containing protein [Wenzhouxiangellaceae bacterium]
MRHDRIATGRVWHRRTSPRSHAFGYRMWLSLLDVDDIVSTFAGSRLWSVQRPNLVTYRRSDFMAPHDRPLGEAVRDRVQRVLRFRPDGRVRMLTHLRQWGVCFNPVTFYFCEHSDGVLQAIVAEVHNTPWNERHGYVLDARDQHGPDFRFEFDKQFHVSPFLPMDMRYDWRFHYVDDRLDVHMRVMRGGTECMSVGMRLALEAMTPSKMTRMPLVFPLMTLRVVSGIYWQAFRLWLKRIPLFTHPDRVRAPGSRKS